MSRCGGCSKAIDQNKDSFIRVDEYGPRIEGDDAPEDPSFRACSWRCAADQAASIAEELS